MLKYLDRKNSNCVKWDLNKDVFGQEDLLSLWVADMDFAAPEAITIALQNRLNHGAYGYTFCNSEFYQTIIDWFNKRFQWQIEKDWIVCMPGVVPTLVFAAYTFTKPGDRILIQSPVYYPFFRSIEQNNRQLIISPLINNNNNFEMDFSDLEKKFQKGIKMMFLCSPHNPVGRVWTREELTKLTQLSRKYEVMLVSDEIHCDIIFGDNKHYPLPTISKEIANSSITAIAPGKTFNIAGNSVSVAIVPNKTIREKFTKTVIAMGFEVINLMGIEAFTAAYKFGEPWLEELLPVLWENYLYIKNYLETNLIKIKSTPLQGTYLMWLDCRELNMSDHDLMDFFVEAGLGLNSGAQFGIAGEGYMRLNIATSRIILEQAMMKLTERYKRDF